MTMKILNFGSCNIDYVYSLDHIVKEGETEVTTGYMKTGMYVEVQDENGDTVIDKNGDLLVYEVVVKGDVNGDGLINIVDATEIQKYLADICELDETAKKSADFNEDSTVNVVDATDIQKYLVNL